jgi:DNA-binding transcriptional ArsR family regulator
LRAFKFVKDPEAWELMADDTRRRVVYLLRAKEMTVSQIAEQLQKTPQAIYHHIRKLLEKGLVEVGREERVDHFIETYYRAAAEVFEFVHGECESKGYEEQRMRDSLQALGQVGVSAHVDEQTVSKMVELSHKMNELALKPTLEEKISKLETIDFVGKQEVAKFVNLLSMSDKQYADWLNLQKEFRELLKSVTAPTVEVSARIHRAK